MSEMSNLTSNPFAALFPSVEKAEEYSREQTRKSQKVGESHVSSQGSSVTISLKNEDAVPQIIEGHEKSDEETARVVNDLLQRVFLIAVDNGKWMNQPGDPGRETNQSSANPSNQSTNRPNPTWPDPTRPHHTQPNPIQPNPT